MSLQSTLDGLDAANAYEHKARPATSARDAAIAVALVSVVVFACVAMTDMATTTKVLAFFILSALVPSAWFYGEVAHHHHQQARRYFDEVARLLAEVEAAISAGEPPPLPLERHAHLLTLGRGETLYWSGAARMMVEKTRTVSTQRVQVAKGQKLFGVTLSKSKYKTIRQTENYMDVEGVGALFVTDKKLVFISHGHDKNWTKTWKTLASWDVGDDAILVQPSSGKPKTFALPQSGFDVTQDASICARCMAFGRDGVSVTPKKNIVAGPPTPKPKQVSAESPMNISRAS